MLLMTFSETMWQNTSLNISDLLRACKDDVCLGRFSLYMRLESCDVLFQFAHSLLAVV